SGSDLPLPATILHSQIRPQARAIRAATLACRLRCALRHRVTAVDLPRAPLYKQHLNRGRGQTPMIDLSSFPRVRLAHLPTPLEPLDRVSKHLGGPRLWVKRDD